MINFHFLHIVGQLMAWPSSAEAWTAQGPEQNQKNPASRTYIWSLECQTEQHRILGLTNSQFLEMLLHQEPKSCERCVQQDPQWRTSSELFSGVLLFIMARYIHCLFQENESLPNQNPVMFFKTPWAFPVHSNENKISTTSGGWTQSFSCAWTWRQV